MTPICRIELLGGVRVWRLGQPVTHFRSRKTVDLLAYLACFPRREHPREVLMELFWTECELDAARHSLNVALSSLRKQLEPCGVADGDVLQSNRFSVRLNPQTVTTDVAEFEAAIRGAAAATDISEQGRCLSSAVAIYTGELLPGHYEDWVIPEQQRLDELYFQALRRLIAICRQEGDLDRALQLAIQAVGASGLREEAHREVIRLYSVTGRGDEALRHYRVLERILATQLDVRPSAETRSLVERIAAGKQAPANFGGPSMQESVIECAPSLPAPSELEPVGGAMPLNSRFYIVREADRQFEAAVMRRDSIILLRGARQVGKTSLLARGLQRARDSHLHVALSHFQGFNSLHFASPDAFLLALAEDLTDQLDLDLTPAENWNPRRGANPNFRRFLKQDVLGRLDRPLVWGMDEVDRLFGSPFATDVFGLFRSWHDERVLEPQGRLGLLTLTLAYSTEAHLFITDLNQSPFNVGTSLEMHDFSRDQVADLNRRYGSPLRSEDEVERVYGLLNGHPFLVRQTLHALTARIIDVSQLDGAAARCGVFGAHLRRLLMLVERESAVRVAVQTVLEGNPCPSAEMFYRLRGAGILTGEARRSARMRCPLYASYLRDNLQ